MAVGRTLLPLAMAGKVLNPKLDSQQSSCCGGGSDNGRNLPGGGGGGGGDSPFGGSGPGGSCWAAASVVCLAMAAYLTDSYSGQPAMASLTAMGMHRLLRGSRQTAEQQLRPRTRTVWQALPNGGTLVVPLLDSGDSAIKGRIVESPLQITDVERKIIAYEQYRVKEVLRV